MEAFVEYFAAIGLFAGDLFTAVGLAGSVLLLSWMLMGRQMRRVPEQIWMWAWGGTLLGGACFAAIVASNTPAAQVGAFFGWSLSLTGGLLALSVALLGLSVALHVSRRTQRRR